VVARPVPPSPSSPSPPPPESQKSFFGSNRPLLRKGGGSLEEVLSSRTRRLLKFSFFSGGGPLWGIQSVLWMGKDGVRHSLQRTIAAFSTRKGPGRRRWPRGSLNAGLKWVKTNRCLRNASCVDLLIWISTLRTGWVASISNQLPVEDGHITPSDFGSPDEGRINLDHTPYILVVGRVCCRDLRIGKGRK
jgi:hypothetical protein